MPLTTINDTAFHEAGHSLITYLNDEFFIFEYVTIDRGFSKMHDTRSIGGIKGKLLKEPNTLTLIEHDKLCVCILAGLAADDINHNNGKFSKKFYENNVWAGKMSSEKYSGDFKILVNHLSALNKNLIVEQRVYTKSCQELLYEMFSNDAILPILLELRNLIDTHKTVTGHEIKVFLDSTSFKEWKQNNWNSSFVKREKNLYSNSIIMILAYRLKRLLGIVA